MGLRGFSETREANSDTMLSRGLLLLHFISLPASNFGGPKVRDHWEDLGIGGRIKLSCTLGR
jgi:hypothetical protein